MQQRHKMNMLIVCQDEQYLKSIEYGIANAFSDKADISFLSDYECLKKYNEQPKDIDILLIEDSLYQEVLNRQNCKDVYILVEDENKFDSLEKSGKQNIIYKYSSIRSMIDKIDSKLLQNKQHATQKGTKLISVYSPVGGCGKTTVSIGLAQQLGMRGNKVLYLSTEMLQDYQRVLGETEYMPEQIGYLCSSNVQMAAEEILKNVKKRGFEYLPAWKRMLPAYGISTKHLLQIAGYIQKKNLYDYIIVELSCEVQEEKLNFLYQSNGVVLVMRQDRQSVDKLQKFMDNIVDWQGEGVIVCNFYNAAKKDFLLDDSSKLKYTICEQVKECENGLDLSEIVNMHILEKTAVAVL